MSKTIYQNDPLLYPTIQEVGCFFRSALKVSELYSLRDLTHEEINTIWDNAKNLNYIDNNDDIQKSSSIINLGFEQLGLHYKAVEVGTFENGSITFYSWVEKYPHYKHFTALIQKVKTENFNTHFRVVDKRGKVIFDPYYPQPNIKSIYYSILYHIS